MHVHLLGHPDGRVPHETGDVLDADAGLARHARPCDRTRGATRSLEIFVPLACHYDLEVNDIRQQQTDLHMPSDLGLSRSVLRRPGFRGHF